MSLEKLSDGDLDSRTRGVAKQEQALTLEVLKHLREVESRRLHAKLGYGSLFSYAVEALGYSEPAAAQRIQAMRLVKGLPEAQEKMESGELSLSTAAAIQKFFKQEEKLGKISEEK